MLVVNLLSRRKSLHFYFIIQYKCIQVKINYKQFINGLIFGLYYKLHMIVEYSPGRHPQYGGYGEKC